MSHPTPVEVRRDKEQRTLTIQWADGTSNSYAYDTLRGYCPCAGCQGHMVRELRFNPPRRPVEPMVVEPVGNYAVSILWSDAHSTGIYRFELLHRLESLLAGGGPILL